MPEGFFTNKRLLMLFLGIWVVGLILGGIILLAVGYATGAAVVINSYGNLLLMRNGGSCVAFYPDRQANVGKWSPRGNDRCYMSDYLWKEAL